MLWQIVSRIWADIVCGLIFLLPICLIFIYFTWPWFVQSWIENEGSSRSAALEHVIAEDFKYEKALQ